MLRPRGQPPPFPAAAARGRGNRRRAQVTFEFGRAHITVSAEDMTTHEAKQTSIAFTKEFV